MSETEYKKINGIPEDYKMLDGSEGLIVGHSELAIHTGQAGKFTQKIFVSPNGSYGYGLLKDGSIIHGCLCIHSPGRYGHYVSFS